MIMTSPESPPKNSPLPPGGPAPRAQCSAVSRKIAILGARGVGKSAITHYCIHGEKRVSKDPHPSVEYAHHMRFTVTKYPKTSFTCCLVDTPGVVGTGAMSLTRNASIGVDAYVLVFSITSRSSFEQVVEINHALFDALGDPPHIPRVLVGNMADKVGLRTVSREVAEAIAKEWGVKYIETSGETGESVRELFDLVFIEIDADNPLCPRGYSGDGAGGLWGSCTIS